MKYLVLLVVLVIAYAVWRGQRQGAVRDAKQAPRTPLVQNMVACAHCGLHLPAADAIPHQGHHYCSPAHRQLGPA